jgi:uncharacterized membrane protein YidH (DUF202 family)
MVKRNSLKKPSFGDPKDHLANERTFLAWIRTSIGIMAFGFVIEKFALFIKQSAQFFSHPGLLEKSTPNNPSYFGIFLIGIGAVIGILSFFNYRKNLRQIERGEYEDFSTLAIVVTALVALIGIFLIAYILIADFTKHKL